ncbi:hypothetical protein [Oerskovia flava]|uniref:hypothetical protein n=1 Tax=Oerskovia flava TaxID=2986422 RepID=UPI00223FFD91|nr:hypothetical protein [Oerskovia sp. JB1-3-2]
MGSPARVAAPEAPGRLGVAIDARELLTYLGGLETWLGQRRTELDRLDEAAQAAETPHSYTSDLLLALTLWQAIRGRADELQVVWDSGRADAVARERMSQLVWGRLDSGNGAALVSLVEAVNLCDALVVQLRTRLSFDPSTADQVARLRGLRAELVRCEDLAGSDPGARATIESLRRRLDRITERAARGGDVSGPLAELETATAHAERDLIVAASQRRQLAADRQRAEEQRAALEAREPALHDLAARCRAEIAVPPKHAVPDVSRLGPVPADRAALDDYVQRLETVGRALAAVEGAYAAPLRERAELRYALAGLRTRAAEAGRDASLTVRSGYDEAHEAVERTPCDLAMARFLVDQFRYLARPMPAPALSPTPPRPVAGHEGAPQ